MMLPHYYNGCTRLSPSNAYNVLLNNYSMFKVCNVVLLKYKLHNNPGLNSVKHILYCKGLTLIWKPQIYRVKDTRGYQVKLW